MQPHVFVSHSHKDSAIAGELVNFLEQYGVACWWSKRDIHPGDNWAEALDVAIDGSDIMLFLLSPQSNRDKHQVLRELEQANNRKIPVLTYRVEDIEPAPGIRFFVRAAQYCDAFNRRPEAVGEELLQSIEALASGDKRAVWQPSSELRLPPRGPMVGSRPSGNPWRKIRFSSPLVLTAAACLALLLCILVLILFNRPRHSQDPATEKSATETNPNPPSPGTPPPVTPPPASPPPPVTPPQEESGTANARSKLEVQANNGDVDAMVELALHYLREEKNYDRSLYWSRRAAELGNAEALFLIGNHYMSGAGVKQDLEAAIEWFQKAADAGNKAAAHNIEFLRDHMGKGTDQPTVDHQPDAELLRKAQGGDAEAQLEVGSAYLKQKDFDQAEVWIGKAALNGNARAMTEYGTMFYAGIGVEKDNAQAVEWWTKGAKAGCEVGKHNLEVFRKKSGE